MKVKSTEFNLRQYRYLAFGIRLQLNMLSDKDKDIKNDLAPILTKLLNAIDKLEKSKDWLNLKDKKLK